MKPKDPIWGFYDVYEEGDKKIVKCKDCVEKVSGKTDRLKNHREKCVKSILMNECNNESIPEGTLPLTSGFNTPKKRPFSSIQGKYLPTIVAHNCQESIC